MDSWRLLKILTNLNVRVLMNLTVTFWDVQNYNLKFLYCFCKIWQFVVQLLANKLQEPNENFLVSSFKSRGNSNFQRYMIWTLLTGTERGAVGLLKRRPGTLGTAVEGWRVVAQSWSLLHPSPAAGVALRPRRPRRPASIHCQQ